MFLLRFEREAEINYNNEAMKSEDLLERLKIEVESKELLKQ